MSTTMSGAMRGLLYDHPVKALAETDSNDPIARDYVAAHLSISPEQWDKRQGAASLSLRIGAATEWGGDLLDGVPTIVLHKFACDSAVRALAREKKAGIDPDKRSWAAITAKRRWLRGEITDEELDAARVAAWTAALAAVSDTAWDVARAAARAASRGGSWDAARAAARGGSWDAARGGVWAAERQWQTQRLSLLCGRYALGRIREMQS